MTDGMQDKTKGAADELKGRGKSAWGDITDDKQTQAEGKGDQLKGKVERGIGDLKNKADEVTDRVGEKFDRDTDDTRR
jgi:uncharacterized protein YjbJ (UPF0337 family)